MKILPSRVPRIRKEGLIPKKTSCGKSTLLGHQKEDGRESKGEKPGIVAKRGKLESMTTLKFLGSLGSLPVLAADQPNW